MVNISFNDTTKKILKSLVGKEFESYTCDSFVFSPTVFGIIGLNISGETYRITCDISSIERFFSKEDVAILSFERCLPNDICSRMDNGKMIKNPIKDTIKRIDIVNDLEAVTHNNEEKTLYSTKGIIFYLTSGNEISFEVSTWFSELITIQKGYNLISKFTPVLDFYEEWDRENGYIPICKREITTIT